MELGEEVVLWGKLDHGFDSIEYNTWSEVKRIMWGNSRAAKTTGSLSIVAWVYGLDDIIRRINA